MKKRSKNAGPFQIAGPFQVLALGEVLHIEADCCQLVEHRELLALHERYAKRAKAVYGGRNRNVFDLGGYVVKLPKNSLGIADNAWEGRLGAPTLEEQGATIQYARARLTHWKDIPVVFMEKVNFATYAKIRQTLGEIPSWVPYVDCAQVGFNRNGQLVAFDYGYY